MSVILHSFCSPVASPNVFVLGNPYAVVITSPRLAESSSVYRVQWEMVSSGGMPIIKYEFQYKRVSTGIMTVGG